MGRIYENTEGFYARFLREKWRQKGLFITLEPLFTVALRKQIIFQIHIDKRTPLCYNNYRRFVPSTKKVTPFGVTFLIDVELCFCTRVKSPGDDLTIRRINRD